MSHKSPSGVKRSLSSPRVWAHLSEPVPVPSSSGKIHFMERKPARLATLVMMLATGALPGMEISSFAVTPDAGRMKATIQGSWEPGADHIIEDSVDLIIWNRISPVMRPAQGALAWNHWQSAYFPLASGSKGRFYRVRRLPNADSVPSAGTLNPKGRLWQLGPAGTPLGYTTSGGWRIAMNLSTITVTSPDGLGTYQYWGHSHENLNGKHLKDWLGTHRTMILPGGAMITLVADGPQGVVESVSIYDVDQTHKIDTTNNSITMSLMAVRVGESAEPDGETMRIWHIGNGRYYAENIYHQEASGDTQQEAVPLGTTGGDAAPNQVNDLYDDKRLGHT